MLKIVTINSKEVSNMNLTKKMYNQTLDTQKQAKHYALELNTMSRIFKNSE